MAGPKMDHLPSRNINASLLSSVKNLILQDWTWSLLECWKVQGQICCSRLLSKGRSRLWWDICTGCPIYHHLFNYSHCCLTRMEPTPDGCQKLPSCMVRLRRKSIVEQPEGFKVQDHETHVCRLKKALYGLKQAPRAWYERINSDLLIAGIYKEWCWPEPILQGWKGQTSHSDPLCGWSLSNRWWPFHSSMQEGVGFRFQAKGPRTEALFPRVGGLAKARWDFLFSRKIHCEATWEMWDGGLQVRDYSNGTQL